MPCAEVIISAGLGSSQSPRRKAVDRQVRPELPSTSVGQPPLPFSRSQLALALSIERSKPEGVTTREYCLQLRKHIQHGKPRARVDHLSIDTPEYWKEQCSRLYSEKKALEVRVAQLESIGKQSVGEVGRDEESANFNCLKELSSDYPSISSLDHDQPRIVLLLKQSLALDRLLQDEMVSTEMLLSAIQSCVSQMHNTVGDICNFIELKRNTAGINPGIIRPLNTITTVFNICLKGLSHLCRDIKGRRCKGQAIYSLTHFFKISLRHLNTLCISDASQRPSININGQPADIKTQIETQNRKPDPVLLFARFLTGLLKCPGLQKTYLCNNEVFEGMYAILLNDLGRIVSHTVFREQISSSNKPGQIGSDPEQVTAPELVLSMELSGRYLVTVLTSAIEGNFAMGYNPFIAKIAEPNHPGADSGNRQLVSRAKQRLQETLLKGIFGQNVEEWRSSLKAPEMEDGWNPNTLIAPEARGGTFMESIWSAVGWDLVLSC